MNDTPADNYKDMEKKLRNRWMSPKLPENVRWTKEAIEIMLRANGYCEYCGADIVGSPEVFWSCQYDHVLPKDHGGEEDYGLNKVLACAKCNSIKRKRLPPDVTKDEMKSMELPDRIAAVRPMVLELRRKQRLIEIYANFREVLELRRAQSNGGGR